MYGCRWNWCRQNFSCPSELKEHVITQHVNLTIPVRKRDLALLRRAHEGIGETLSIPIISSFDSETRSSSQKDYSQETSQQKDLPPSPPFSSPAQSPFSQLKSLQNESTGEQADISAHGVQTQAEFIPTSPTPSPPQSPISFGRLRGENHSPTPLANPGSPSFDSLVERKKPDPVIFQSSSPAKSSNSSQMAVEQQLTQSLDYDDYSDKSSSSPLQSSPSRDHLISSSMSSQVDKTATDDLYAGELRWGNTSQASSAQQQPSSGRSVETLSHPSQPPSQFQAPLIHVHRSRGTQSSQPLGTPTGSLIPPTFAISTPPLQSWYQPSTSILKSLHRRSSLTLQPSPSLSQRRTSITSSSRSPKRVRLDYDSDKMSPAMEVDGDEYIKHQSQSQTSLYDDSFDENQPDSYPPLQTQAPYDSQF
ncbi:hypothetical protein BJ165DRAFT_1521282 [Panaeolus papilionaceus]|nr:hypothetical protein BJ165DRAFT_1521282 [Panaeolus papilionaceus]